MYSFFKFLILKILKIPDRPSLPVYAKESEVKIFRASYNYYRYKFYLWLFKTVFALGCELGIGISIFLEMLYGKVLFLEMIVFGIICGIFFIISVIQRFFSYIMLRLDYEMRWYIITDKSIRIREGITKVKEMTMTIANIQNMSVSQGPVQRLFKISDVKVETAGGGRIALDSDNSVNTGSAVMHIAYFRGVDNSSEILEMLRKRLESFKTSGLGDTDENTEVSDNNDKNEILYNSFNSFILCLKELKQEIIMLGE